LETGALVLVAAAQLLLFSCYASWSGDVGYGPRFMFEAIVMLMPLTLPAFEAVADFRSPRATITIAALVGFGMAVQLIGAAVYETVNEWYRANEGIFDNNAFVFVPGASPIIVDLKELVAGRNLAPWALRAWAHPGPALVLWVGLMVVVVAGGRWLAGYFRAPSGEPGEISSERLPAAIVLTAMLPILAGFALVRPIKDAPGIRAFNFLEAGLAAQAKGENVAASENYAMVLSLDPSNKFARYDLGILEQDAGYTGAALALYGDALRADPNFTPARLRIAGILQGKTTN
jgi:tetratricopeptide (TPR) repeat protein